MLQNTKRTAAETLTQSVALSLRISDTDSVGISTLTRLILPQGSVLTLLMTPSACKRLRQRNGLISKMGW